MTYCCGILVRDGLVMIADTRTNRILIVTRPMNMDYIKKLIKEFDVAVDLRQSLIYSVKCV